MRKEPKIIIFLGLLTLPMAVLALELQATASGVVAGFVGAISIGLGIAEQMLGGE